MMLINGSVKKRITRKKKENKKVRNATENVYDGITFKSKLETYVYKQLKAHNLKAEYEPIKFELIPAFTFCGKKIRAMTYTPDFVGDNFIIEAKGKPNDVFYTIYITFYQPLRFSTKNII